MKGAPGQKRLTHERSRITERPPFHQVVGALGGAGVTMPASGISRIMGLPPATPPPSLLPSCCVAPKIHQPWKCTPSPPSHRNCADPAATLPASPPASSPPSSSTPAVGLGTCCFRSRDPRDLSGADLCQLRCVWHSPSVSPSLVPVLA